MKATLTITLLSVGLLIGSAPGCKGETKFKDKQETLDRLAQTEDSLKEKTALITTLNAQLTELRMNSGSVVVSMEGPKANGEPGAIMEVKGNGPNGRGGGGSSDPKGNAKDTELYSAFVEKVRASRGSIKKCYEGALKKRSDLAARSVTIAMAVDYRTTGQVSSSSFSPQLTPEFGACMKSVAGRWKLPAMPATARFTYRQKLTPQ